MITILTLALWFDLFGLFGLFRRFGLSHLFGRFGLFGLSSLLRQLRRLRWLRRSRWLRRWDNSAFYQRSEAGVASWILALLPRFSEHSTIQSLADPKLSLTL